MYHYRHRKKSEEEEVKSKDHEFCFVFVNKRFHVEPGLYHSEWDLKLIMSSLIQKLFKEFKGITESSQTTQRLEISF